MADRKIPMGATGRQRFPGLPTSSTRKNRSVARTRRRNNKKGVTA